MTRASVPARVLGVDDQACEPADFVLLDRIRTILETCMPGIDGVDARSRNSAYVNFPRPLRADAMIARVAQLLRRATDCSRRPHAPARSCRGARSARRRRAFAGLRLRPARTARRATSGARDTTSGDPDPAPRRRVVDRRLYGAAGDALPPAGRGDVSALCARATDPFDDESRRVSALSWSPRGAS